MTRTLAKMVAGNAEIPRPAPALEPDMENAKHSLKQFGEAKLLSLYNVEFNPIPLGASHAHR